MRKCPKICLAISFFAIVTILLFPRVAMAHQYRFEHNAEIEQMLFNQAEFSVNHKRDDEGKSIDALESALYLCVDQFGTSGEKDLNKLKEYGVSGLPKSVKDINPTGSNLSPSTHRGYSHRGWEVRYYPTRENQQRFATRRSILLNTANVALKYDPWHTWTGTQTKQCESFCALLYYTHILGDYLEDVESDTYKKFNGSGNGVKIAFARSHVSDDNPDLFWELEKHLAILFEGQTDSRVYKHLISDIDTLANRSRRIAGSSGGVNTIEEYNEIKGCVKELMVILGGGEYSKRQYDNRIHMLLLNEPFFTKAFPSA